MRYEICICFFYIYIFFIFTQYISSFTPQKATHKILKITLAKTKMTRFFQIFHLHMFQTGHNVDHQQYGTFHSNGLKPVCSPGFPVYLPPTHPLMKSHASRWTCTKGKKMVANCALRICCLLVQKGHISRTCFWEISVKQFNSVQKINKNPFWGGFIYYFFFLGGGGPKLKSG